MLIRHSRLILGLLVAITIAGTAHAENFPRLDEALPRGGHTARYAPVFDFDTDSCLPAAGFSRDGIKNAGLRPTGSITGSCRYPLFLETSNTLHRWACTDWGGLRVVCAHFYELYFEKDQCYGPIATPDPECGHRHDWEDAVVWTFDGVPVAQSVSAHGDYLGRTTALDPFKVVYHKDGLWTHAMRFAHPGEVAENPYRDENNNPVFVTPPIVSWYQLAGDSLDNQGMRDLINGFCYNCDSNGGGSIAVADGAFVHYLNWASNQTFGFLSPSFTEADTWASNPNNPVLELVSGDGELLEENAEYVLDFGTVTRGFGTLSADLAVGNDVDEPADSLDGDFDISGAAPYVLDGFESFTGLQVGKLLEGLSVQLSTRGSGPGVVSREIEFQPKGLVDTGFREPSDPITLTLTANIVNQPPIADAGRDQTVECTSPNGATVTLDGTGSVDPDGDPIEYVWTNSFGTASGPTPTLPFPLGTETVSLVVYDDAGAASAPDTVQVTVQDTVAPETRLTARPDVLWPPNGKMVSVRIGANASDTCDAAPVCRIMEVSSNEGRLRRSDWKIESPLSLELRAKREGKGSGRTYTIGVQCVDGSGNRSLATTDVLVPHDRSKKKW